MKLVSVLLIIISERLLIFAEEDKHVHLRIYIPEIVKHNIHTKTVFIHVHIPSKKKKHNREKGHLETYHENWNSWNAYNNHGSYNSQEDEEKKKKPLKNYMNHLLALYNSYSQDPNQGSDLHQISGHGNNQNDAIPFYDDYKGETESSVEDLPDQTPPTQPVHSKLKFDTGVTGYSYPPQYATHEDVDDISPNDIESYEHREYEGGHRQGHYVQKGGIYEDDSKKFYDEQLEEASKESIETTADKYGYVGNNYVTKMLYA